MQFDDRDPCDVQWVNLTDSSVYQSVYINTGLVWARRSLHTSGRNSVVGWPARVSTGDDCMCVAVSMCMGNWANNGTTVSCIGAGTSRNLYKLKHVFNTIVTKLCILFTVLLILCWGRCLQTNGSGGIL